MNHNNSDGVNSDGGTPPVCNDNLTSEKNISKITPSSAEEDNQNTTNTEVGEEYTSEFLPSFLSSYQYTEDDGLSGIENLDNLRNRLTYYMYSIVLYQSLRTPVASDTDSDDSIDYTDRYPPPPPPPSPRYNYL